MWHLRKAAKRGVTYADLRQRHLSDYRSNHLRWIPLVVLVATVAFTLFFAPHLGATLELMQSHSMVDMLYRLWMLSAVPCAIVVVSLVAEFLMSRLARLSRLLITSDPTISQRADNMLRATAIAIIQAYVLASIIYLGMLQDGIIVRSLFASRYWQLGNRPYNEISGVFVFTLLLTLIFGGYLTIACSRPGGKLSLWPWQTKHAKQPRTEQ